MSAFTPDLSTLKPIASSPASTFSPDMNTLKPIGESDESRLSRPSTLGEMGGTAADIARGVGKGLHSSAAGISSLLNKIPGVGETLAPSRGVAAYHAMAEPSNTGEQVGKGIEQGVEFFLPAGLEEKAGLKALELAPKLGQ